jgi:hypothetical protein
MDDAFDTFDAIADALRREAAWDQRAEARDIVAGGDAGRSFAAELRRVAPGEVVAVVTADGAVLTGRVVLVGRDWLRVEEVADPVGAARARARRRHDVPFRAVVRVAREGAGGAW